MEEELSKQVVRMAEQSEEASLTSLQTADAPPEVTLSSALYLFPSPPSLSSALYLFPSSPRPSLSHTFSVRDDIAIDLSFNTHAHIHTHTQIHAHSGYYSEAGG